MTHLPGHPALPLTPLFPPFGGLQLPVYGWKIWRNQTQFWSSDSNTLADVDNRIQAIVWFHKPPYYTRDYGNNEYVLADGTGRLSGTAMSPQAWATLETKMLSTFSISDWTLLGVEKRTYEDVISGA